MHRRLDIGHLLLLTRPQVVNSHVAVPFLYIYRAGIFESGLILFGSKDPRLPLPHGMVTAETVTGISSGVNTRPLGCADRYEGWCPCAGRLATWDTEVWGGAGIDESRPIGGAARFNNDLLNCFKISASPNWQLHLSALSMMFQTKGGGHL